MEDSKRQTAAQKTSDAISLLIEDHNKVKKLFKEFEGLKKSRTSKDKKSKLVKEICTELTIHAQVEEEVFYPAVRKAIDDQDLMDEAEVEHAGAKELISQLEEMSPDEDLYDAKVTVLSEYIDHHVKEEEQEMFPSVKKTKLDLSKLGAEISKLKEELKLELENSSATKAVPSKKQKSLSR